MTAVETIERDGYVGEILVQEHSENPREDYDHVGILVQLSPDFMAPSKAEGRDWRYAALVAAWDRYDRDTDKVERYARAFLGAVSVEWHDDPTSSSRIVAIMPGDAEDPYTDPVAGLKAELAEYVAWCNGEVYGYVVRGPDGEDVDDCWGYYGEAEWPYVRSRINEAIDGDRTARHAANVALFRRLVNA